jgi:predicted nucleic acid-binding protein
VRFADTNVLLYSISRRSEEQAKSRIAFELVTTERLGVSVQVLQEFYTQAIRPTSHNGVTPQQAEGLVRSFTRFAVQELRAEIVLAAIATSQRYVISYWDAAIIEAARALGCAEVLSEDLSDGQDYGGVIVRNPFGSA